MGNLTYIHNEENEHAQQPSTKKNILETLLFERKLGNYFYTNPTRRFLGGGSSVSVGASGFQA